MRMKESNGNKKRCEKETGELIGDTGINEVEGMLVYVRKV